MVLVLLLHSSCCLVPFVLPVSLLSWTLLCPTGARDDAGKSAAHFLCNVQEEIDEEALPCLSVEDLQSVGITNTAHQRLILSAAMQPATQHVARPDSTAQPSKSCLARSHGTVCSAKPGGPKEASSTTAVLPTRALPGDGLNGIAAAVACKQNKATSVSANAVNRATPPSKPAAAVLSSVPSQPRSAAASRVVASAVAPSKTAGVTVRSGKPPSNSAKSAAAALAIKPFSHAAVTVSKTAVAAPASCGVKKAARPAATIAPAKSAIPAAASATCSAPTANSNQKMPMMLNSSRAVETQVGTSGLAAAANRGAAVLAPRSKADEARQLAMALSASVGADTGGPFRGSALHEAADATA